LTQEEALPLLEEFLEGQVWPLLRQWLNKRISSLEAESASSDRMENTFRSVYAKRVLSEYLRHVESLIEALKEYAMEEKNHV
jgi:hypothetical protein